MKIHVKILLALIGFLWVDVSAAFPIPKEEAVPGGVAYVSLGSLKPTQVLYQGQPVMLQKEASGWRAIVGIPLATPVAPQTLIVIAANGEQATRTFDLQDKHYEEQHLTIKNKRKVNPYAKDMERIIKEKRWIVGAFKHWSAFEGNKEEQFILPVNGPMSSPFGRKRFFNKQPRKPHSGLDIAADEGTPIIAVAAGTVILIGNYFFNGNSVFIDHGQGLISMYCHMQTMDVRQGQTIQQGEVVGQVGQTGRVTGPHLHWSVSLNNARIDPLLFFEQSPFKSKIVD